VIALILAIVVLGALAFVLLFHELTNVVERRRRLDEREAEQNSRPLGNVDVLNRRGRS
jgi:hypothetical protein